MNKLKALIFDVDGTLADTEKYGHRVAFNRAFASYGLNWEWSIELYGELLSIAGGKERIRYYLDRYQPHFTTDRNLDELIANLHQAKTVYYQTLLIEAAIPLRPGVARLLKETRNSGITMAIATTSAYPNVIALLSHTLGPESVNWFTMIAAGDIVAQKKPAPDIYLYVLENMQLKPSDCLVLEDSHHGLQAALQAGLKTIVTINDYTKDQDFHGASLVVDHLGEPEQPLTVRQGTWDHPYISIKELEQVFTSDWLK